MKKLITILIILSSTKSFSQDYNESKRYIFGTFHTRNTTINGISIGAFPSFSDEKRFIRTNGIRLEIPGIGPIIPLFADNIIPRENTDEIINGLNISGGTIGNINYNGITLGLAAQSGTKINGIALTGLCNGITITNGIQVSGLSNQSTIVNGIQISFNNSADTLYGLQIGVINNSYKKTVGLQIGIYNNSKNTKGIQIGLWNENENRKLPIINWNF
jgi:hypothetical protein